MLSRSMAVVRSGDVACTAIRMASSSAGEVKGSLKEAKADKTSNKVKTFEIYRFNPEKPGAKPEMQVGLLKSILWYVSLRNSMSTSINVALWF